MHHWNNFVSSLGLVSISLSCLSTLSHHVFLKRHGYGFTLFNLLSLCFHDSLHYAPAFNYQRPHSSTNSLLPHQHLPLLLQGSLQRPRPHHRRVLQWHSAQPCLRRCRGLLVHQNHPRK